MSFWVQKWVSWPQKPWKRHVACLWLTVLWKTVLYCTLRHKIVQYCTVHKHERNFKFKNEFLDPKNIGIDIIHTISNSFVKKFTFSVLCSTVLYSTLKKWYFQVQKWIPWPKKTLNWHITCQNLMSRSCNNFVQFCQFWPTVQPLK